jgi:chloride channel protein, CIC family
MIEGEAEERDPGLTAAWLRHAIWLAAAVLTGAVALLFHWAEGLSVAFTAWAKVQSPLLAAGIALVGLVVVSRLRDLYFRGTEGTGIPQAIAALKMGECPERGAVLSVRIVIGKILLLLLGLFSGATIGREGPSVHVGAALMYLTSRIVRLPAQLVRRGLILAGGAAGIAAAFNAPIAGIVFAFEEIGRSFEKSNAGTIVRTVAAACLVCVLFLGNYLFYGRTGARLETPLAWAAAPLIGFVGGLLGGLFAQTLVWLTPRYQRFAGRQPWIAAAGLGLVLGLLGLVSGGLTYGSGFEQAQRILIGGADYPFWYPLAKSASNFVALLSGIPGGLFDPSLSVGAALGQLLAPVLSGIDRQAVVLMVMAAYFTGVVQSPITVCVILFEMTGSRDMVLPLLVTTVMAYEGSHLVCRTSLYEALADIFLARRE